MLTPHFFVPGPPGGDGPRLVLCAVRSSGCKRSSSLLRSDAVGNTACTGWPTILTLLLSINPTFYLQTILQITLVCEFSLAASDLFPFFYS